MVFERGGQYGSEWEPRLEREQALEDLKIGGS